MNIKKLPAGLCISLFAFTGYAPNALASLIYAIDDFDNSLKTINTNTYAVTTIGSTGIAGGDFGDLAYDSVTGTMYWVAGRNNNNLYTVNLGTGAATLVGATGIGDNFTLGFNGSTLFGQSTGGGVFQIDQNTGTSTLIGANGVYPGSYEWNSLTNQMLLLEAGLGGGIFEVNLTNGSTSLLSSTGNINDNGFAYDFSSNTYWALDWSANLYQFDASFNRSLVQSGLFTSSAIEFVETTAAPVPEPASIALIGLSLAGIGFSRKKKKV